jgi:hypothetical protein
MAEILAIEAANDVFDVTVTDGASKTEHEVRATSTDLTGLGLGDQDPRAVVEETFRFLLEKEPKEAILASFELARIRDFFPDYPEEIKRRFERG